MKKHVAPLLLLAALVPITIGSGCGGNQSAPATGQTNEQSTGTAPESAVEGKGTIFLDGLYATSTAAGRDVATLFSGNGAGDWRTKNGAGPDEGIMLYFSDRQQVSVGSVEISAAENSLSGEAAHLQIYQNGQMNASGKPGQKIALEPLPAGQPLRSIYIRIAATGRETSGATRKNGEQKITVKSFPASGFVALQKIQLFDVAGQPLRIVPPRKIRGTVAASSTLAPEEAYASANLFDSRKEFVWAEGAENSGEGETLTFNFEKPVRITALQIWNGYQRSDAHFSANARAKGCAFGEASGNGQTFNLGDRKAGQRIELSPAVEGKNFTLKINNIFKGGKYKDLAISELLFFDGAQPFTLASDQSTQTERTLRQNASSSPLAQILDRRLFNQVDFSSMAQEMSLILRSDGTFVMYDKSQDGELATETVADGNWTLESAGVDAAKVKVFGKWYDFSLAQQLYRGNGVQETTRIFNDVLTVDNEQVRGGKLLGTFWVK